MVPFIVQKTGPGNLQNLKLFRRRPPNSRMITTLSCVRFFLLKGNDPAADQLPAIVQPGAVTPLPTDTHLVPALIAAAGEQAGWRYVEFFTANIRNPHTRRAFALACSRFFARCEDRGLVLTTTRPFDVATYIETLIETFQQTHSAPGVKQQLAAARMLFDWLITGQVVPFNPASAVRGPKHVVKTGVTPVLDGKEWRKLIACSIDASVLFREFQSSCATFAREGFGPWPLFSFT
jgi:hypothetical protein